MINRLIEISLRNRFLLLVGVGLLAGAGYLALKATPIDAIPDLSDNQVIVFTDWPGRSPQEVEDQITYPLSANLQGLAGVRTIRASSAFGFSMINVIFDDAVDLYFARSRVIERLNSVSRSLPSDAIPQLGPDATAVGQVFWYTVDGPYDPGTLRSLQDWFIRYQLNSIPGVAEVASVGGFVRQYQIDLDPLKLRAFRISIHDVFSAVQRSNSNVGAKVIESNDMEIAVRGLGLIQSVSDIEKIVVGTLSNGTPVTVRNVATVQVGPDFRRGVLNKNGIDAVGAVVIIRQGANARDVIAAVKSKIALLEPSLPKGLKITPFYDRSELIDLAMATLRDSLFEEILLVVVAHVIFLWHFRSILIVTLPLPLSVLTSFLLMRCFGVSSNIMSLGGIAIAIGVLVDAGIVMTENVLRNAEQHPEYPGQIQRITLRATQAVGRPVFYSMMIIILSFIPVFALTGPEGKLFRPLVFTKTFAMVGSTLFAMTLVPVLCAALIRGRIQGEDRNPVMRAVRFVYRPALNFALKYRGVTLAAAIAAVALAAYLFTTLGSEFMPYLDEGTAMWMPVSDPRISLTKATELLSLAEQTIAKDPAVRGAVGKIGRAETATDPAPINMAETIITFKPKSDWPKGETPETIIQRLDGKLRMPGVTSIWTQPIRNRIDMLSTGIRTQVGVKVFGKDLQLIEQKCAEIADVLRGIRGAVDVYPEPITVAPYLDIHVDRDAVARFGITTGEVQDVIETAVGGKVVTWIVEGRDRYSVRLRYARDFIKDPEGLRNVLVSGIAGVQVPLGEVAQISNTIGPSMISSENGLLRGIVLMNVRDRDPGGFVNEARETVSKHVNLQPGTYLEWSGEYENSMHARSTLLVIVPLALFIVFLLLFLIHGSTSEALQVLLSAPFALTGGVFLLKFLDYNLSVAVWVGFIALFGTAVQTGVVMQTFLREAVLRKEQEVGSLTLSSLQEAVIEGALLRLRPKLMTVSTVVAGLLPIIWSTKTGADVLRPIAVPVLGGMGTSLIYVLVVMPVIFMWSRERRLKAAWSGLK